MVLLLGGCLGRGDEGRVVEGENKREEVVIVEAPHWWLWEEVVVEEEVEVEEVYVYVEPEVAYESYHMSVDDWKAVVCTDEFSWDCEWAIATLSCESSFNPNAVGVEGNLRFYGGFQVWNGPVDPYLNAVEAHIQYVQWQRGEKLDPWPNCP